MQPPQKPPVELAKHELLEVDEAAYKALLARIYLDLKRIRTALNRTESGDDHA